MSQSEMDIEIHGDFDDLGFSCMYVMYKGIGVHRRASTQLQFSKS